MILFALWCSIEIVFGRNLDNAGLLFCLFIGLFWLFAGYFLRWSFRQIHPVYFDDNYLYWGKDGEEMVLLENILEVSVKMMRGGGRRAKVVFCDDQLNKFNIRFLVIHPFMLEDYAKETLHELQRQIRFKKPDFDISDDSI
jgi:hypothetical protein